MKYTGLILFFTLLFGCSKEYLEPDFLGVTNIRVAKMTGSQTHLNGVAHFNNPNKQQLKLKQVDVKILLDDKVIGTIDQEMNTKIPSQSTFEVPLSAAFNIGDIGLLNGILSVLGGNKLDVQYQGYIKVSYFGYPRTVPVDFKSAVKL